MAVDIYINGERLDTFGKDENITVTTAVQDVKDISKILNNNTNPLDRSALEGKLSEWRNSQQNDPDLLENLNNQIETETINNQEVPITRTYFIDGVEVRLIANNKDDLQLKDPQKKVISDVIKNFGTQVSDLGDLRPGITIESGSVRLDGVLPDVGLNFVIIAGVNKGIYLNTSMLKISYDVLESTEKLLKFEDVFSDSMNDIISERRID